MKKYIKKFIAVIVSVAIMLSMVSVNVSKAEEVSNEELIMNNESGEQDTTATENDVETTSQENVNSETTSGIADEEMATEETTSASENGGETTSGEPETVIYNENQSRVVSQIKIIPESTQEDYMDKVKALYIDYLTLTEDEVNGLSAKDKAEYESILKTAGEINHTDIVTGVSVSAESLPWYVKVSAEKTDEVAFQDTYEAYWDAIYAQWEEEYEDEECDEDWDDEEDYADDESYWEDEVYEDEEDLSDEEEYEYYDDSDEEWYDDSENEEYYDEEDADSEDYEEYDEDQEYEEYNDSDDYFDYEAYYAKFPRTTLGHSIGEDRFNEMAASYKVSLYNILEEQEYTLPEGTKIKISLPYLKEYMGYGLEIVQLQDDSSYDILGTQLFNKPLGQILTYGLYTELYGDAYYEEETEITSEDNEEASDDEEYEDENYEEYDEDWDDEDYEDEVYEDEGWDEEAYRIWAEEENSKINIDDYVVEFETGSFSEFAVRLTVDYGWAIKEAATGVLAMDENKESAISPKTGISIDVPFAVAVSSGLLVIVSLIFYRKRDEDIV